MRIAGIAGGAPSRVVDNDEALDLIAGHSRDVFSGDLTRTLRMVGRLFEKSGIQTRRWLAPDEHPMTLMQSAFEQALAQAGLARHDIDLLIYASVTRGFTEPANSTFVSKRLGLSCRNFDLVDACMGWISAAETIDARMRTGRIRHAAIVNIEAPTADGGSVYPKNFTLNSADELAYKFPSFTLGNAVTVTILSDDGPDNFSFDFVSRPDLSELCTISLPGWRSFCNEGDAERIAPTGGMFQFSSYGGELHEVAGRELINVLDQSALDRSTLAHVFTHTSSPRQWDHFAQAAGIFDKLHGIGHWTGNIVTASVPLAIVDAIDRGVLKRDDACLAWVGSAGMVFSAVTFAF